MKATARSAALEALLGGGDAAEQLDRILAGADLDPRDRALATELAYGTLKMRRALGWSVQRFLSRPLADADQRLRWVLLLGAYQLLYLDRVPAHSAVDESVTLARARGHLGAAAVANAVLRRIAEERPRPPRPESGDGPERLGTYASLPDWIAAHLIERFGFEDALRAAEGMNGPPRRVLRVDTARQTPPDLAAAFSNAGVVTHASRYGIPECLVVEHMRSNQALRAAVADGRAAWQSEESQLAVHLLDPRPGESVLDVCSGRGVKTMMIARRVGERGVIWSLDDDVRKIDALRRQAEKTTSACVRTVVADARKAFPAPVPREVDAALVDAPCSGLGILGRRPDARWRKREGDPARFAVVQSAVIKQAASHVRRGGRLLYATCSTHRLEDECIVDAFLAEHPDWRAEPVTPALVVPGIDGADGFFYALLRRL